MWHCPVSGKRLVSIHAPARGATAVEYKNIMFTKVSIHAPARGATGTSSHVIGLFHVSIHAPARGATRHLGQSPHGSMFQSTPPRGGRLACLAGRLTASKVSIHAPARGATELFF